MFVPTFGSLYLDSTTDGRGTVPGDEDTRNPKEKLLMDVGNEPNGRETSERKTQELGRANQERKVNKGNKGAGTNLCL